MNWTNYSRNDVSPALRATLRHLGLPPTRFLLGVSIQSQRMVLWEKLSERTAYAWPGARSSANPSMRLTPSAPHSAHWVARRVYRVSTSKFGIDQKEDSHGTPLGLHRIARKIGGGRVMGTVFRGRRPVGNKWTTMPEGRIMHRILWLEGLEPGWNRGGRVDTFRRYIYIHGCGDESALGRPDSHGCVHLAMDDLLPLFDRIPVGTLVWIERS